MSKTRWFIVAALIGGTLAGCFISPGPVCRTDCWWDHGRKICERRCR
jgi:hypothetical protein